MRKPLQPLDRPSYWLRVVPIVVGHLALSFAQAAGVVGASGADNGLIIWLAVVLAQRFRDIGWPVWIGPTFLIVTMIALPIAAIGYAFTHPTPEQIQQLITVIGLFAPANLVLLVVAGSMPGRPAAPVSPLAAEFE